MKIDIISTRGGKMKIGLSIELEWVCQDKLFGKKKAKMSLGQNELT